jgi:hypothetical protein
MSGQGNARPSEKAPSTHSVHEVVRSISVSAYRLISTSNTHASNKATRIEKTMPATSQYRPPNPPASTAMPATTNGSVGDLTQRHAQHEGLAQVRPHGPPAPQPQQLDGHDPTPSGEPHHEHLCAYRPLALSRP